MDDMRAFVKDVIRLMEDTVRSRVEVNKLCLVAVRQRFNNKCFEERVMLVSRGTMFNTRYF